MLIVIFNLSVSATAVAILLIAIMLARVSMTQMQNVLTDALVVITTSEFDGLAHSLDCSNVQSLDCRLDGPVLPVYL